MRWASCFALATFALGTVLAIACSDDDAETGGVGGNTSSAGGSTTASGGAASGGGGALPSSVTVTLVPADGISGTQRVNFALPLEAGQLSDETLVKVLADGTELAAARRGLAPRGDGSLRSVQLQVDVDVDVVSELAVEIGAAGAGDLELAPVEDTLVDPSGESGPRVWVLVPAQWLSGSR
ncbi:MAG TPA: hypothetical protein VFB62_02915, partial [Polyangiaceae bacterium]|nr:hypothetical protein [Polyangiaceae bacterium]